MKPTLLLVLAVLAGTCLYTGCTKDKVKEQYTYFQPVYETRAAVVNNIRSSGATAVLTPGKMVIRGNYIFLNEIDKGVHVIDFSNPAQPKNLAFINIPGNIDISLKDNYLYADCYTALAVVDISDINHAQLKQYINGVFPERYYGANFKPDTANVIIGWQRRDTTIDRRFGASFVKSPGVVYYDDYLLAAAGTAYNNASTGQGMGIAGSTSRFALLNNRLYAISNSAVKIFNTSNTAAPVYSNVLQTNQAIETLYPFNGKLFIGSQTGMSVYDASNADQPALLGQFAHVRNCDPVIADNNTAYVTLHSTGSFCGGMSNELDVLDITTITHPTIIKTYQLSSPKGLSKDGNLLFVCDEGLKIYNAADPANLQLVKHLDLGDSNDVIAWQNHAIVVAAGGLYFIDYTNAALPVVSGSLPVQKQ